MSLRLFTIIGDANVWRNLTGLNIASRESMKSAQVLDCVSFSKLDVALNDVRAESNILFLAAVKVYPRQWGLWHHPFVDRSNSLRVRR